MVSSGRPAAAATENLEDLRKSIHEDPSLFVEEYRLHLAHFQTLLDLQFKPSERVQRSDPGSLKNVKASLRFLVSCANYYPEDAKSLGGTLQELLETANKLPRDILKSMLQSLFSLCNRKLIDNVNLINATLPLAAVPSKELREELFTLLLSHFRKSSRQFPIKLVEEAILAPGTTSADIHLKKFAIRFACAVAREGKSTEDVRRKAVNVLASVVRYSKDPKLVLIAMGLFIDDRTYDDQSDSDLSDVEAASKGPHEDRQAKSEAIRRSVKYGKVSKRKKQKLLSKAKKLSKPMNEAKTIRQQVRYGRGMIELINSSQEVVEAIMKALNGCFKLEPWTRRLVMLKFCSNVIEIHTLYVASFYPYVARYMKPKIEQVDQVLIAVIRATHPSVDGDVLEGLVQKLADEWIQDWAEEHVLVAGLKALRELVIRCPWCAPKDILLHSTSFKKRGKAVLTASQGLLKTCRVLRPDAVERKQRGKELGVQLVAEKKHELEMSLRYGEVRVATGVPGIEKLEKARMEEGNFGGQSSVGVADGNEVAEESGDGSGSEHTDSDAGSWVVMSDADESEMEDVSIAESEDDNGDLQGKRLPLDQQEILQDEDLEHIREMEEVNREAIRSQIRDIREESSDSDEEDEGPGEVAHHHSTSNSQKERLKPFMMVLGSRLERRRQKKRRGKKLQRGHFGKPKRVRKT